MPCLTDWLAERVGLLEQKVKALQKHNEHLAPWLAASLDGSSINHSSFPDDIAEGLESLEQRMRAAEDDIAKNALRLEALESRCNQGCGCKEAAVTAARVMDHVARRVVAEAVYGVREQMPLASFEAGLCGNCSTRVVAAAAAAAIAAAAASTAAAILEDTPFIERVAYDCNGGKGERALTRRGSPFSDGKFGFRCQTVGGGNDGCDTSRSKAAASEWDESPSRESGNGRLPRSSFSPCASSRQAARSSTSGRGRSQRSACAKIAAQTTDNPQAEEYVALVVVTTSRDEVNLEVRTGDTVGAMKQHVYKQLRAWQRFSGVSADLPPLKECRLYAAGRGDGQDGGPRALEEFRSVADCGLASGARVFLRRVVSVVDTGRMPG